MGIYYRLSKNSRGERERGARRPRAVRETGRSKPNEKENCKPSGAAGRPLRIEEQREALRSPGIPGQRSAGRYEDPSKARKAASELANVGGPKG